jgi:acetyl-CoA carboxylase biotin carboxyl carrier protein
MDFKQIQELIKLINKSNIGEVSIEENDFKITIRQKEENITQVVSAPQQAPMSCVTTRCTGSHSSGFRCSSAYYQKPNDRYLLPPSFTRQAKFC